MTPKEDYDQHMSTLKVAMEEYWAAMKTLGTTLDTFDGLSGTVLIRTPPNSHFT